MRSKPPSQAEGKNSGKKDSAAKIASALKRVHSAIERSSEAALATHNLHHSGLEVLELLSMSGPDGLQLAEIAKRLGVTPASITNRIDHLTSKKWVERRTNEKDRRYASAVLTGEGRKVLEAAGPLLSKAQMEVLSGLKKGDRKDLLRLLEKVANQPAEAAE